MSRFKAGDKVRAIWLAGDDFVAGETYTVAKPFVGHPDVDGVHIVGKKGWYHAWRFVIEPETTVSDQVKDLERENARLKERLRVAQSGPEFTQEQVRALTHEIGRQLAMARKGEPGMNRTVQVVVPYEPTLAPSFGTGYYAPALRTVRISW